MTIDAFASNTVKGISEMGVAVVTSGDSLARGRPSSRRAICWEHFWQRWEHWLGLGGCSDLGLLHSRAKDHR